MASTTLAFLACFIGSVAAVGSRIVGGSIVMTAAFIFRACGQQRLVLNALVPAYAMGRLALNALAASVKVDEAL